LYDLIGIRRNEELTSNLSTESFTVCRLGNKIRIGGVGSFALEALVLSNHLSGEMPEKVEYISCSHCGEYVPMEDP
jgi:hypothetical protein